MKKKLQFFYDIFFLIFFSGTVQSLLKTFTHWLSLFYILSPPRKIIFPQSTLVILIPSKSMNCLVQKCWAWTHFPSYTSLNLIRRESILQNASAFYQNLEVLRTVFFTVCWVVKVQRHSSSKRHSVHRY